MFMGTANRSTAAGFSGYRFALTAARPGEALGCQPRPPAMLPRRRP